MPAIKKSLARYRSKRDFRKTREPAGAERKTAVGKQPTRKTTARTKKKRKALVFVIQQHDARQLHFDLRLELDGVMKSWAVPKGPSLDPSVKRLAMEVEDHPIEYNEFEGVIPQGQYGGGTVMIWDRGTYAAERSNEYEGDDQAAVRAGLAAGQLKFTLQGERLTGSFVLVRTRRTQGKQQWLLIKHRDGAARRGSRVETRYRKSVVSGRTMAQIAAEPDDVWHSSGRAGARKNERTPRVQRTAGPSAGTGKRAPRARKTTSERSVTRRAAHKAQKHTALRAADVEVQPMLATLAREMPEGDDWTYEPKYDGVRVLAFVTAEEVRLVSRNGNDKTQQFPEIVRDLMTLPGRAGRALALDGEIVALVDGRPARFQQLQSRTNVTNARAIARLAVEAPAALVVFDLLADGNEVLVERPWSERRKRLERRMSRKHLSSVLLGETHADAARMLRQAQAQGWEGLLAKRTDAPYRSGRRTRDWLKLKIEQQQEFVVGGYTEPRRTRQHLGALLLGYYDQSGNLIYAGHTGTGFTRQSLADVYALLTPLERRTSQFKNVPRPNERPHWVSPTVVVEVRFNEWTRDGHLRQPVFLGVRTDKDAADVVRETEH